MAARLGWKKNWKDSAGLILVSGPFKYARPPTPLSRVTTGGENPLIVPMDESGAGNQEWETVLVKRSSNTGFYADTYVFPGGRLDTSDSSHKWRDLFQCCSPSLDPFHPILSLRNPKSPRLPIYGEVPNGPVLGEIAFRICAIRELFEEAGVLLARDNDKVTDIIEGLPSTFPPAVKTIPKDTRNYWREKVHDNGGEFLNLCCELQCVPDIWALVEWSDWLTPRNLHVRRRYDTVFYLCFSETQPAVCGDGEEIVDATWFRPSQAIKRYVEKEIILPPPQFAEINFLRSLGPAPCVHSYALLEMLRNSNYRRSPIRILTKDKAILSVMNSDDLYPAEGNYWLMEDHSSHPHHPQSPSLSHIHLHISHNPAMEYTCPTHTAQELRDQSDKLNRMEFHKTGEYLFFDTVLSENISKHLEEYGRVRDELGQVKSKL